MKNIILFLLAISLSLSISAQHKLHGTITYNNVSGTPIAYTTVILKDSLNNKVDSTYTWESGYYVFYSVADNKYKIELQIQYAPGGFNTVDALLTSRHFVKESLLTNPLFLKAANVNNDKFINTVDALQINRRFVKIINNFYQKDSWLMDDNEVTVSGGETIKHIKVVCTGDVNGSFVPVYDCPNISGSPLAGSHIATSESIEWHWTEVPDAMGYKFNVNDDYSTATDIGNVKSYLQNGLSCNQTYTIYVWAYNYCGKNAKVVLTHTTGACSFICGNDFTDSRDGKTYKTVLINTQCWFKESLNIGTKINTSVDQSNNGIIEKHCYNDDENNCNTYGGLYKWDEAMGYDDTEGGKGICPTGWHIPTESDWGVLCTYLGGNNVAGGKLKETGTTHWQTPNTGATNSSGFTALGSGMRDSGGGYYFFNQRAYFWSSTKHYMENNIYIRGMQYGIAAVAYGGFDYIDGVSIRCIKN